MEMLRSIISGTPVFVWFIFAIVLVRGIKRLKTRETKLSALIIMPAIFLFIAVHRLIGYNYTMNAVFGITLGVLAGIALAIILKPQNKLSVIDGGRVRLEGEWQTLAIALLLFAALYAQGVVHATEPVLATIPAFTITIDFIIGLAPAFYVSRAAVYLLKVRRLLI